MPPPKGKIFVICGFRDDGTFRAVELSDADSLKVYVEGGEVTVSAHALLDGTVNNDTKAGAPAAGTIIVGTVQGDASILWQLLSPGSEDDGLKIVSGVPAWSAPVAGGNYSIIEDITLEADGPLIDFANIPTTYKHLKILASLRGIQNATADWLSIRVNNDSGNNYDRVDCRISHDSSLVTYEELGISVMSGMGTFPALTAPEYFFSNHEISLNDYLSTDKHKAVYVNACVKTGTIAGTIIFGFAAGFWRSTVAVNRLELLGGQDDLAAGSRATLYGLS